MDIGVSSQRLTGNSLQLPSRSFHKPVYSSQQRILRVQCLLVSMISQLFESYAMTLCYSQQNLVDSSRLKNLLHASHTSRYQLNLRSQEPTIPLPIGLLKISPLLINNRHRHQETFSVSFTSSFSISLMHDYKL